MSEVAFRQGALRMILLPHEIYTVSDNSKSIRVLSGQAWLSVDGHDVVLFPGDHYDMPINAVISALNKSMLMFEVAPNSAISK
jgi:hypothetical protein